MAPARRRSARIQQQQEQIYADDKSFDGSDSSTESTVVDQHQKRNSIVIGQTSDKRFHRSGDVRSTKNSRRDVDDVDDAVQDNLSPPAKRQKASVGSSKGRSDSARPNPPHKTSGRSNNDDEDEAFSDDDDFVDPPKLSRLARAPRKQVAYRTSTSQALSSQNGPSSSSSAVGGVKESRRSGRITVSKPTARAVIKLDSSDDDESDFRVEDADDGDFDSAGPEDVKQIGSGSGRRNSTVKSIGGNRSAKTGRKNQQDDDDYDDENSDRDDDQEEIDSENSSEVDEEPPEPRKPAVHRKKSPPKKKPKKEQPRLEDLHPELDGLWDRLKDERHIIQPQCAEQPPEITMKMLPFQLEGLNWLQKQEDGEFNGGILADEMGMGKTIQMLSLIISRRTEIRPTLIICPTVAMHQWAAEIHARTLPNTLEVLLFHGSNRPKSIAELQSYDVVLSSYSIMEQGFRRQTYGVKRKGELIRQKSVLHAIKWGRVVLDEAHAIKDRSNSTARAAFALDRDKQWSITGTPLQNRVGELYSLVRFMNVRPYSLYFCRSCPCTMETWKFFDGVHCDSCGHVSHKHFCWWNAEILRPIQKYGTDGPGLVAFSRLRILLDRIMLRRTKLERTDELGLPPRVVVVRRDVFNEAEEELVTSLYSETQLVFNTYARQGTVLNNYASLFTLLSRMRLAANHPHLVTTRIERDNNVSKETLVCCLCHDQAEDAIMSKCKHVFCRVDAEQYIQSSAPGVSPKCPACMRDLSIDLTQPEILAGGESGASVGGPGGRSVGRSGARTSIINDIDLANWRSSTKIEALVEELTTLQRESATSKALVFSQFVAFLDLIQWRLSRAGFNTVKLDGCMGPEQRARTIKTFMTDPSVTVFLVSLKAGGVALNLTEASRVYIMDPWWNPAVEDQAFDRIHRLGQHRPIQITRMIIENSIESRILALQEKKKALFQSTVGRDADALAKLTEEDLRFLFVM